MESCTFLYGKKCFLPGDQAEPCSVLPTWSWQTLECADGKGSWEEEGLVKT